MIFTEINGFLNCFSGSKKDVVERFLKDIQSEMKENEDLRGVSLNNKGELSHYKLGSNGVVTEVVNHFKPEEVVALQEALLSVDKPFENAVQHARMAFVEEFRFTYYEEENGDFSIGLFASNRPSLRQLVKTGTLSEEMLDFILLAMKEKKNLVISGTTGSGKTTLLNNLANAFAHEKVGVSSPINELRLDHEHILTVPTGDSTVFPVLLFHFGPERVIIDELRVAEFYLSVLPDYPTLVSTHASSPKQVMERLMYRHPNGLYVGQELGNHVQLVIQITRLQNGKRVVSKISEVIGFGKEGFLLNNKWVKANNLPSNYLIKNVDNETFYLQDVFRYNEDKETFERTNWKPLFLG